MSLSAIQYKRGLSALVAIAMQQTFRGSIDPTHRCLWFSAKCPLLFPSTTRTGFLVDLFAASETTTYIGDKKPIFGFSKTATFPMPESLTQLIQTGMELGDADDQIFGRHQSKQGSGTIGILTNGLIDRSAYYEHALQLALIPWIRPDLYPHGIQ